MTAHTLSSLLRKHFNIYSRSQRRDKQKRRGYQQSDFTDAWQRYLPAQQTGSKASCKQGHRTICSNPHINQSGCSSSTKLWQSWQFRRF
jgi:hypothetical protein